MKNTSGRKHKDLLARVDEFLNKSRRYSKQGKKSRSQTPRKMRAKNSASRPILTNEDDQSPKFGKKKEGTSEAPKSLKEEETYVKNIELRAESPAPRVMNGEAEETKMKNEEKFSTVVDTVSQLDKEEIERFNQEYGYLSDRFSQMRSERIEMSRKQRDEIEKLENYRNQLKSKINQKSKNIDQLGGEVVKMEVGLSKLVNTNKNLTIQNEEMRQKLYKLSELANDKEREMSIKIAQIQDELFETRAYYEHLLEKIEYEKDKISEETRISYEDSIDPVRQEYNMNQAEIESYKDKIRGIELSFQALKDDIVRDIEVIEKRTIEDCEDEFKAAYQECKFQFETEERELRAFESQYNDGARELQLTQKKILETKIQYKNLLENLFEERDYLEMFKTQQKDVLKDLRKKEIYAEELLEKKIEEVEHDKQEIGKTLDNYEQEYENLRKEEGEELDMLRSHLEGGKERIFKLEEAIQSFENECTIIKEKNRLMINNLQNGFNQVFNDNKSK